MKKTISENHKFSFNAEIVIIRAFDKILVISPSTANWLVLENENQLSFFNLLKRLPLGEALRNFKGDIADCKEVVTQIVAREFENHDVRSCITNDTKQLHLYLTNGCNLRCPHCYMYSGAKKRNELTLEEVKRIILSYSKHGGKSITLSGGEVSTRSDLQEIVDFASGYDLKIRILTNGVLWSEEQISYISNRIDAVQVSVDGYSEDSNAFIRGKGNFIKSLKTLDSFIKHGVPAEIAITPPFSLCAEDEVANYVSFCNNLLIKYKDKPFKIKIAEQLIDGRDIHLTEHDSLRYYKFITQIKTSINGWGTELESFIRAFKKKEIMDNCMYGVFAIDATGDVFFCSRVSSLKPIGNIREMEFKDIFEKSRKAQDLSKIDNFRPCKGCELRYICGGGCRIDYFPEFAQITDIDKVDFTMISERKCSDDIKNRFYKLMIESNIRLYH